MLEQYRTVYEGGEGEITEKKSRFIATVHPVESEEEALAFLEEMKKKYWDARHNCYVYSIGMNRDDLLPGTKKAGGDHPFCFIRLITFRRVNSSRSFSSSAFWMSLVSAS